MQRYFPLYSTTDNTSQTLFLLSYTIDSISQSYIWPIVCGKVVVPLNWAKLELNFDENGMAMLEKLSFDVYN